MRFKNYFPALILGLLTSFFACKPIFAAEGPNIATPTTQAANAAVLAELPFGDKQDFEDVKRGFIATLPEGVIKDSEGNTVWDIKAFSFLDRETAPPTVNPSLWRMARLNMYNGLFAVKERIYQIRGFDLSNMTIIEGTSGIIIIDPLSCVETAKAALDLYRAVVPGAQKRPVMAVIYTHSHVDHYGGVEGVISREEAAGGKTPVLAPEGFLEEAVSENVFAGNAMHRRASYMYGMRLPYGERGRVDAGLGKTEPRGRTSLIPPTDIIRVSGEKRIIDGVEIEFQMAPGTEAPAEMLMYFPQYKALCAAEDATHTLHNLYTLRGAKVRDANKWWRALDEALSRFGTRAEILFAQHHWPVWGAERVRAFLEAQRDGYKYLHDQTLRLANQGYTPDEISESLHFPPSLDREWSLRGYYGTVSHNVRAIYQYYLGWFDGNPANLHPLPPKEAAIRYVEFMGGSDAVLQKARVSYGKGEFRWVAEVLKHVVFADPKNIEARNLQADTLEQLGYQAESGPWRGFYLTGAGELRDGLPMPVKRSAANKDTVTGMSPEMVLDFLSVHLNAARVEGKILRINWSPPDARESYALTLQNSVLLYTKDALHPAPAPTLLVPCPMLVALATSGVSPEQLVQDGQKAEQAEFKGDSALVREFFTFFDAFSPFFPIVTREGLGKE